jgi:hypothetical protein
MKNNPYLGSIPRKEMECRRAFEEWMRSIGLPGKLGKPDSVDQVKMYDGWRACWLYLKEKEK